MRPADDFENSDYYEEWITETGGSDELESVYREKYYQEVKSEYAESFNKSTSQDLDEW